MLECVIEDCAVGTARARSLKSDASIRRDNDRRLWIQYRVHTPLVVTVIAKDDRRMRTLYTQASSAPRRDRCFARSTDSKIAN